MPNNFKLTGDYYVSKAGNDSNNGLTPETPKRTVQAALNLATSGIRTIIVGSGVYRETLIYTSLGVAVILKADGYCVLEGGYSNYINIFANNNPPYFTIDGFEIRGYPIVTTGATTNSYLVRFINCIIKGTDQYFNDNPSANINNIWINCNLYIPAWNFNFTVRNCTFINCKLGFISQNPYNGATYNSAVGTIIDCSIYNSVVRMISSVTAANFNYNNFYNSSIIMTATSTVTSGVIQDTYGRYYDLSIATSTGDGTIGNPYGRPYTNGAGFAFSAHRTAYPTFNASSSAVDPGFNNILKQDFTLQSSSFMVGRASDFISNIGGTPVATRLDALGSLFSGSNATVDNLVFAPFSDYVISGSAVTGSVTSAPIFISSSAKVIQEIDYNGLLAFNKDATAPTGSNVNVPDVLTYTSASNQPGANPDRLTYYMRWTTGSSQPVSDAQWENGGLWPAGSFNVFEWNTKPSVDFLGRGNGDQNFNIINTPTFVKATWIQLRVSLRNNYLI